MKTKLRNQKGFTIIEVLIVLAIAGLILLIVFLAVPALQRNSRNTQRKNDVASILGAVTEFMNNNNGTLPTAVTAPPASPGTVRFGCGLAVCTTSEAKVGYYNKGVGTGTGQVTMSATYTATGPFTAPADDRVAVVGVAGCSAGATIGGAARAIAAVYEIERGAGLYAGACDES
jgi:prepilin-type N-terminal cleavage/methylation domain-containing protein